jgi:hypothetical protein
MKIFFSNTERHREAQLVPIYRERFTEKEIKNIALGYLWISVSVLRIRLNQ